MKTVKTLIAGVAIALVALASVSCKENIADKKIGIQLYSVMNAVQENPKASVERLAAMGYNVFELVQWGGSSEVFGMSAEDFKALCDANGVTILSTHSSLNEDPENEEENMNNWRKLFEVQKTCGGSYFVIPGYGVDYTTEAVKHMCEYFNKVGAIAKEYGLKLGYHNHSGEFIQLKDSDQVMWEFLVENTDPDLVCFELDVYWCTKGHKDPVEYLKKYPNRIELLHVKDEFVVGETGEIDFEGIFNQFYANGWKDYVVEVETPRSLSEKLNPDGTKLTREQLDEEMFEGVRKSAEYLKAAAFVK